MKLITGLPVTRRAELQHFIQSNQVIYVFKKLIPYAGFGAFTTWATSSEEANCTIEVLERNTKFFVLKSTKEILIGEEIVCYHAGLIKESMDKEC